MSLALARKDRTEASRVRGARFEFSGSFGFICSLLCNHATILLEDPGGTPAHSPYRAPLCCLPRNVSGSASTSYYLRGCFNLRGDATSPAAWLLRCLRFADAVPPSFNTAVSDSASGSSLVTRWLPRLSMTYLTSTQDSLVTPG